MARSHFVMFGTSHLAVLALTLVLPLALAGLARRRPLDRLVRWSLAAVLAMGWIGWYWLDAHAGLLTRDNSLPLNLCDWAEAALILALLTRSVLAYELGYFWGLGGTLQGVLTPTIYYDYPDPQFFFFFIQHSGVVVALLYLTLGTRLRPRWLSLRRVVTASFLYLGVVALADWALGVNYGFLRAKPLSASLFDFLSPWPWYIPELVAIGFGFVLVYYLPFALADAVRGKKTEAAGASAP
jgi:hypothetical integral membrane protein (TIGR02206 family)